MFFEWLNKHFGKQPKSEPEIDKSKWGVWLKLIDPKRWAYIQNGPVNGRNVHTEVISFIYCKIVRIPEHRYSDRYFIAELFTLHLVPKKRMDYHEEGLREINLEYYEPITDIKLINKLHCLAEKAKKEQENQKQKQEQINKDFNNKVIRTTLQQPCS